MRFESSKKNERKLAASPTAVVMTEEMRGSLAPASEKK